jgi:phospholipase C
MTQYAALNVSTTLSAEPGQSRMFRLPTINPGQFVIQATGHSLAENIADRAVGGNPPLVPMPVAGDGSTAGAPRAAVDGNVGGVLGTGMGGLNAPPGGPTGPTGPVFPPPYPVSIDLFHGETLVVSSAAPIVQQAATPFDDTWRARINFPSNAQPTDTIRINLSPYTGTLPIQTRGIPLSFLQQGFDNNWNGRKYISLYFEDGTLGIIFDPEIASYYKLSDLTYPVISGLESDLFNASTIIVQDINLSINSSDGGFEDLSGPLPYVLVTVKIGGIGNQPISVDVGWWLADAHFSISDFSINVKFFLTTTNSIQEDENATASGIYQPKAVVGYRTQVGTDLMENIAATNAVGDVASFLGKGKANSALYQKGIPALQNFLDSKNGLVGDALTPWLLGAAYAVNDVRYDPNHLEPAPTVGLAPVVLTDPRPIGRDPIGGGVAATGAPAPVAQSDLRPIGPNPIGGGVGTTGGGVNAPPFGTTGAFVPQGDIVIDYVGLEAPPESGGAINQLSDAAPPSGITITSTAPDGAIGAAYSVLLAAAGGAPPYVWSSSGALPAGLALSANTLIGTPTALGLYRFTLTATDTGGSQVATPFAVAINSPGFVITTSSTLPDAVATQPFAVVLLATGGAGAIAWSASGLPDGLTISAAGVISGTPAADGAFPSIVVEAVDAAGNIARRALTLSVLPPFLFGNVIYTPRGAADAIWNPPAAPLMNPGLSPGGKLPPPVDPGNLSKIQHIVVLMMENRSFDHMLGYLSKEGGRTDVEGLKWENDSNRTQFNFYNGRYYYPYHLTQTHLFDPEPTLGPDHSFESVKAQMADNMGHFVSDYARAKITDDDPAQLAQVMGYYTGAELPTYDLLAREFAICDHWFCSHPGPTWPNRFVYLTGDLNRDSHGEPEVNTPDYADFTPSESQTIFDLLTSRNVTWAYFEQRVSTMRAYTKYTFDLVNVREYSDQTNGFAASVAAGLPSVTFVDPLFGDLPAGIGSPPDNDDAPPSDLADGQKFVWQVVDTLFTPAKNPNWLNTMLIVVYDEHGGFYDHVQPPSDAVPLLGQNSGKLGPRVPAFVVSPWTPAGLVLKDQFDHTSIAATILRKFCGPFPPFMSARVSAARDLRDALSLSQPRGTLTPLLPPPAQEQSDVHLRTAARAFSAPSSADSFGSLLGAIMLNLGLGQS